MQSETPERYIPDERKWEQKSWLYEKYWGELKSVKEICEEVDITTRHVREKMVEFGIPRRKTGFKRSFNSPFAGFYSSDENAKPNEESQTHYDEDQEPGDEKDLHWQRIARQDNKVSEKAYL